MSQRFARSCNVPLIVLAAWMTPGAPAQTTQPAMPAWPTIPYADAAFGFELQLPAGWTYDRARFQRFQDSIGLLRGRDPRGQLGLQIQVFRIQPVEVPGGAGAPAKLRIPSFEDWMVDFGKALAESVSAERIDWEPWNLPPRAGALLIYDTKIGAVTTRTFTLCVPFDLSTVWVFVYSGTLGGTEGARLLRQQFDYLAHTLRVHYDPVEVEQMVAALQRGRELIEKLRLRADQVQLDETEYYYTISIGDDAIGYLRRRVAREEHAFTSPQAQHRVTQEGLRVRERSWRFASDGTVRHSRIDLFSSFALTDELIEVVQTQLPAPDVPTQQLYVKSTQAVRKNNIIVSSFTTNLDRTLPAPGKPLDTGPAYLDLAWMRVCPGLLLTAPPEPHAFATYDTETRALLTQVFTPLGPRELEGDGQSTYAFEVREGLIDNPGLMYVDRKGTLVRLVAGDLVIQRVTRDEVEKRFGKRRDAACARFGLKDD